MDIQVEIKVKLLLIQLEAIIFTVNLKDIQLLTQLEEIKAKLLLIKLEVQIIMLMDSLMMVTNMLSKQLNMLEVDQEPKKSIDYKYSNKLDLL